MYLKYFKWSNNEYSNLNKKFKEHSLLNNVQFYFPILSMFFNYSNSNKSRKTLDVDRRFRVIDIVNCIDVSQHCSNKFLGTIVYDKFTNSIKTKKLFLKSIPIIDIIHYCTNKYDTSNSLLPSNYRYNIQSKINNMNNSAYIDAFFSIIASNLYLSKKTPSLSICYGTYVGTGDYIYNVSSEFSYMQEYTYFNNNIGHLFDIAVEDNYYSDNSDNSNNSDDGDDSDDSNYSSDDSNYSSDISNYSSDISDDSIIILSLKNIPLQQVILERLEGTLEDYLNSDKFNMDILLSCFFQITFCLAYLQKQCNFSHNDLHINNVMYTSTKLDYLYYKFNNIYFKVPTYGKIFKIIDFGRSVFDFNKKKYFSDCFSKHGEADGQYTYPIQNIPLYNKDNTNNIQINYSFDLCRLSTTILDALNEFSPENSDLLDKFMILLNKILSDKSGECIYDPDNVSFQLYIDLAKYSCNGIPKYILNEDIFDIYKIKKNMIYNNNVYNLN